MAYTLRDFSFVHFDTERQLYICRSHHFAFEAVAETAEEAKDKYLEMVVFDKEAKKKRGKDVAKESKSIRLSKLASASLKDICDNYGVNESRAIEILIYWHESCRLPGPEPVLEDAI